MVQIQFFISSEDKFSPMYGPYEFVQATYEAIRVGSEGEDEIAYFYDGMWYCQDGVSYSDFSVTNPSDRITKT